MSYTQGLTGDCCLTAFDCISLTEHIRARFATDVNLTFIFSFVTSAGSY